MICFNVKINSEVLLIKIREYFLPKKKKKLWNTKQDTRYLVYSIHLQNDLYIYQEPKLKQVATISK